ncbi:ABC transporter substrate-binding protein [Pseudodesulfovibrio sediminis]|uniref:Thiamine pyrimidine synthase n=1 Tax=Pseudodesulfovibrio sediminis TaxID=2810563 RepID=A0ABM7P3R0_9BACT|nr:ABC transporter substrate-binding protein [Pseudodesulfovibrio sediminis]BCS88275.1 nitrate ABC transporter substrate-binding protein [Pseudodesulfovibrio sediminis]
MTKRPLGFTAFLLFLIALTVGTLPAQAAERDKARIVLQWLPQAQFSGFYMAQDKGFYAEAGIDLTIISGGPDVMASDYLKEGKAEFATMFLTTGLQKHETMPIVNIGQFVQRSALMLIAKKSSGITSFADLDGRKVGLWANEFEIQPRAFFHQKNMNVTVVPQTSSLDLFLRGGVDAASGMWYNEYHTLYSYGLDEDELVPLFFSDVGLNFPEDGIYCLQKTVTTDPSLCRRLVEATVRGWKYAFAHKEEALQSVMRRMREANVPTNTPHQRWMLARMEDIIAPANDSTMGMLRWVDYDRVRKTLLKEGFLKEGPPFGDFYKGKIR